MLKIQDIIKWKLQFHFYFTFIYLFIVCMCKCMCVCVCLLMNNDECGVSREKPKEMFFFPTMWVPCELWLSNLTASNLTTKLSCWLLKLFFLIYFASIFKKLSVNILTESKFKQSRTIWNNTKYLFFGKCSMQILLF